MSEEVPSIGESTERIPFFLLGLTVFSRGAIFTLLNGPLLYHALRSARFNSFAELLKDGLIDTWGSVLSTQTSLASVLLLLLLSFVVGFAVSPIPQGMAGFFAALLELPKILRNQRDRLLLFSPIQYANRDYIRVMEWLSYNRRAKAQWEWQQFYYHLWWSYTASILLFGLQSVALWPASATGPTIIFIVIVFVFLFGALYHSWHMGNVHRYAVSRINTDPHFRITE